MAEATWFLGGVLTGLIIRAWRPTVRVEARNRKAIDGPCVIALWHGRLLGVLMDNLGSGLVTMASRSSDGAFAAGALRTTGLRVARGSSSRGGREALSDMSEALESGAPRAGLTVDGPRGPWRQMKPGAVALAIRHDLPVVPATFSCRRSWRLGSWDRMVLPKPLTRVVVAYGEPWSPQRLRAERDGATAGLAVELDRLARELDLEVAGRELWPDRASLGAPS